MRSQWKSNLIVGIFVVAVLSIFMYFIMNYTNELGMFEPRVYIYTTYDQPEGLFAGGAVQLNNLKIGRITYLKFVEEVPKSELESIKDLPKDLPGMKVLVQMEINKADLNRIGKDGVAAIARVGLLGDNIINIEAGNPAEAGSIEAYGYISSKPLAGLFGDMDVEGITSRIENILDKVDKGGIESISSSMRNVSEITEKINNGEGTLGKLVTDDDLINEVQAVINELNARIREAKRTVEGINKIVRRVNEGPGSVHTLIYKDDVGEVMADLKNVSKNIEEVSVQINELVKDIKDQDMAKKIGEISEKVTEATDNLVATTESVANIVKGIEEGEGTVGALIKDPTLYEDLKIILQGAKRSKALQYAVQHTIAMKQKEAEREGEKNPAPPPEPKPLPEPEQPAPEGE